MTKTETLALQMMQVCLPLLDSRRLDFLFDDVEVKLDPESDSTKAVVKVKIRLFGNEILYGVCRFHREHGEGLCCVTSARELMPRRFLCSPKSGGIDVTPLAGQGCGLSGLSTEHRGIVIEAVGPRYEGWDVWSDGRKSFKAWHESWVISQPLQASSLEELVDLMRDSGAQWIKWRQNYYERLSS